MSHLLGKKPNVIEQLALDLRAARHRGVEVTIDDLLKAIDLRSGEKTQRIVEKAEDYARKRVGA